MKKQGKRGQAPRNRNANGDGQLMHVTHPPKIPQMNVAHGVRMRFICAAAAAQANITYQNLLDTFLIVTSATVAYDLFQSVRLRAVEIWATPILGQATTTQVVFVGSSASDDGSSKIVTDTSMGIQPAHIRATPGRLSPQALWQNAASASVAFQITCPAGSVIDLELSFKNRFGAVVAAQNAVVGGATGSVVNRGFDGLAIATTKFTPVTDFPM